jgi:DnaK suppressor protein
MTSTHKVCRPEPRIATSPLSDVRAEALRELLRGEIGKQTAELARQAATLTTLTASPSEDMARRNRALAALRAYRARQSIEDCEDALVRLEGGRYGTCQSCDRPMQSARLEEIPQARFCAACPAPPIASGGRGAASPLARGREHTGAAAQSRVRPRQHLRQPGPQSLEKTHGSPTTWW